MAEKQETNQAATPQQPPAAAQASTPEVDPVVRSNQIISKYEKWAGGLGLIPVPLLDAVTIGAVQVKMVMEIAQAHGFKVKENVIKTLLAGILGAHASANLGYSLGTGFAKLIPGVGTVIGLAATPALGLTTTRVIGRIFNAHFASGGTILNFDPKQAREQFLKMSAATA